MTFCETGLLGPHPAVNAASHAVKVLAMTVAAIAGLAFFDSTYWPAMSEPTGITADVDLGDWLEIDEQDVA